MSTWVDASKYQAEKSHSMTEVSLSTFRCSDYSVENSPILQITHTLKKNNIPTLKNFESVKSPEIKIIDFKSTSTSRRTLYEKYALLLATAEKLENNQINILKSHMEIMSNIRDMVLISYAFTGSCKSIISMNKIDPQKIIDLIKFQQLLNIDIGPCYMERNHMWKYIGRIPVVIRGNPLP